MIANQILNGAINLGNSYLCVCLIVITFWNTKNDISDNKFDRISTFVKSKKCSIATLLIVYFVFE